MTDRSSPGTLETTRTDPRPVSAVRVDAPASPAVRAVLPTYNEAPSAPSVVEEVLRFAADNPAYTFLFVDDGSSDGTPARIRGLLAAIDEDNPARGRVTLLELTRNGGKGRAVASGVGTLDGAPGTDLVIFTDGDLAYTLDHLPRIAAALEAADVAIGSRYGEEAHYGAGPVRRVMGWAFNRFARVCLGASYRDTQAGLKGFRLQAAREIFGRLTVTDFAFDVEVLFIARRRGLTITEVPARVRPEHRSLGTSVSLLRDPARMLRALLAVRVNDLRGRYR